MSANFKAEFDYKIGVADEEFNSSTHNRKTETVISLYWKKLMAV